MANLITLARLLLLYLLVHLALQSDPKLMLFNAPLLLTIIGLDGVDGWVARRLGEESRFGSVFDILADRVVENVLWIVLAHLGLVPIWIAIAFLTRGIIVDGVRYRAVSEGQTVFGKLRSPLGTAIVAGRLMRGLYGAVKAAAFGWLFLIQPWPRLIPEFWDQWAPSCLALADGLVALALAICLLRAFPVVAQWLMDEGVIGPIPSSHRQDVGALGQPRWRLRP